MLSTEPILNLKYFFDFFCFFQITQKVLMLLWYLKHMNIYLQAVPCEVL